MDAGSGMLYPAQVVDGLVHQHGGSALRDALRSAAPILEERPNGDHLRCRIGDAVLTAAPQTLPFDVIAHTPPPFYHLQENKHAAAKLCVANRWESQLVSCYVSGVRVAAEAAEQAGKSTLALATPLLGAGARGAPTQQAARLLVRAFRSPQMALAVPPTITDVLVRVVLVNAESEREVREEMGDG